MEQETKRELERQRRSLWRIYAELPDGTLPPRVESRLEKVVAPGYRKRIKRAFLASLEARGQ